MADLFVDSVIGASSQYDPVTRSATGGTYNSYATMQAAHDAASAGDTIYLRSGGETVVTVTSSKAIKWRNYGNEDYTITSTGSGTGGVLKFTTVAGDADFGGHLIPTNSNPASLTNSHPIVRFEFANSRCHGVKPGAWGTTTANQGGCLIACAATPCFADRWLVIDGLHDRGINSAVTATITCNAWVFKGGGVLPTGSSNLTVTMNNPTCIGCSPKASGRELFECATAMTLTINNPIVIGNNLTDTDLTRYVIAQTGTGVVTISGGVIHDHLNGLSYLSAGTVTNTADSSALVKFKESNPCYVAICLQDSTWATADGADGGGVSNLTTMLGMLANYPAAKLNYFPDDHHLWNPEYVAQMSAWLAAGHELGSWGLSGSDNWAVTTPFTASYSGGETNVRIVVTNGGTTWNVVADSGPLAGPYDCSQDGAQAELGVYYALAGSGGNDTVLRRLVQDVAGLSISLGPGNSGTGGFDDAASLMIQDDDYALPASPPINRERRIAAEVDRSRALTYQHLGVYPTVFYCNGTANNPDVGAHCQATGWNGMLDNGLSERLKQRVDTFDPFGIYRGLGNSGCAALFGTSETNIRAGARRIASWGFANGGLIPLVFTNASPLTPTQFGYLIDEFLALGVELITFSDAISRRDSVFITPRTDYTLADGSAGAGTSTRFWTSTAARPTGANGEPYPDIDIDCGACPGRRGAFHPSRN